ncbi:hypothetical protein HHX48_04335 [Salinimonas sp. HHU 13199]|uniref:Uncharacterized protein n=1 Tax=Salinimonas profundi TaxID=2729140 RepID=A0ABR8LFC8_9ALTE|nr:hypothetical protein [Salinimonas profundi]MBD3584965.1 hypothetical protein [Salinimonas profundi]
MKKLLLSTVSVMAFVSAATAQAETTQPETALKKNAFVIELDKDSMNLQIDMKSIVAEQAKATLEQGKAKYLSSALFAYQPAQKNTVAEANTGE